MADQEDEVCSSIHRPVRDGRSAINSSLPPAVMAAVDFGAWTQSTSEKADSAKHCANATLL